jgi:hypothetical protein
LPGQMNKEPRSRQDPRLLVSESDHHAGNIHRKASAGNWYRLSEVNGHRIKKAANRLVADQDRDHRGMMPPVNPREIAKLARPEGKTRVLGILPGIGIAQCG